MNMLCFKCHVKKCVCVCVCVYVVSSVSTAWPQLPSSPCRAAAIHHPSPSGQATNLSERPPAPTALPPPFLSLFLSFHTSFLNLVCDSFLISFFLCTAPSPTFLCSFSPSLSQLSLLLPAFSCLSPSPLTFKLQLLSASSSSLCSQRRFT